MHEVLVTEHRLKKRLRTKFLAEFLMKEGSKHYAILFALIGQDQGELAPSSVSGFRNDFIETFTCSVTC